MKYKRYLLLLITPLLMGVTSKNTKATQTIIPTSSQIGPFEQYQEDVTSSYTLTSTFAKGVSSYERLKFVDISTGNERNVKTATHTIQPRAILRVDFVVPTSEFLGPLGMEITITVYDARIDSILRSCSETIYPAGHDTINPLNYVDEGFTSKPIAVSFPAGHYAETLSFDNYNDYFLTDIYYRLPFEQFDFTIENKFKETPCGAGFMLIRNGKSLFPNLTNIGKNTTLNIKVVKIGDIYRICLKNSLYVNPNTLLMSSNPLAGYVATDNFYFPINKMGQNQGLDITFNLLSVGYNKTNLSWTSTYYPTSSIIGPCNSSEYCIVGGVNQ